MMQFVQNHLKMMIVMIILMSTTRFVLYPCVQAFDLCDSSVNYNEIVKMWGLTPFSELSQDNLSRENDLSGSPILETISGFISKLCVFGLACLLHCIFCYYLFFKDNPIFTLLDTVSLLVWEIRPGETDPYPMLSQLVMPFCSWFQYISKCSFQQVHYLGHGDIS